MQTVPNEDDFARIRSWFERLAERVRAVDFVGARLLFAEDFIAFGTVEDLVTGRDAAEAAQWRQVWPFITEFRWRSHGIRALVSPDRLAATGLAVFDSTGYHEDGSAYE